VTGGLCARCGEALPARGAVRGMHGACYHRARRAGEIVVRRQHRTDPTVDWYDERLDDAIERRWRA
jgi:hypothetical protein